MKRGYFEKNIKESFILLKNNPTLFIPDLLITLITLIVGVLFLYYNNLIGPLLSIFSGNFETSVTSLVQEISSSTPKIISLIVSFVISIILALTFGLSYTIFKYYLVINNLNDKHPNLIQSYFTANKSYFSRVILMSIILFLLFLIPLAILFFLAYSLDIKIFYVICAILLFLIWILLRIIFFFNIPILFNENKSALMTLKESYKYTLGNKMHTFLTFLITLGISWAVGFIINISSSSITQLSFSTTVLIILFVIFAILRYFINLIIGVWSTIFLFKCYKN